MSRRIWMTVPVFVAALAPALSGEALAGGAPVAPKKDGPYVKFRIEVEIRGTLRHTDKGTFVETREEVQTPFPTLESSTATRREEQQVRWRLDLGGTRLAPKDLGKLNGKEAVVSGKAELREVAVSVEVPGEFLGTRLGRVVASHKLTTFELRRVLKVTELKAAGSE